LIYDGLPCERTHFTTIGMRMPAGRSCADIHITIPSLSTDYPQPHPQAAHCIGWIAQYRL
jgi:hypothetical protein